MDLSGSALFYYEAYEREIDSDDWVFGHWIWRPLSPVPSAGMATNVSPPTLPLVGEVLGFDVVVFDDYLEHSPLSCNSVAAALPVNSHCLLDSLDSALDAVNSGVFRGCEEGVYRIYKVSILRANR